MLFAMERFSYMVLTAREAISSRIRNERGAAATEYALIIAFGVLVVIVGVTLFGSELQSWYSRLSTTIKNMKSS